MRARHCRLSLATIALGVAILFAACDDDDPEATIADAATTASDATVADTGTATAGTDATQSSAPDAKTSDTGAGDVSTADTSVPTDVPTIADVADTSVGDTATSADTATDADAADTAMPTVVMEMEPNDGATLAEVNALETGQIAEGAIATADDADVFQIETVPGEVYVATLSLPAGSTLEPNLTVIDDGRGGDPAGGDYVKIAVDEGAGTATVSWLAMGGAGYYLIVRDDRNVPAGAGVGSSDHTWNLAVEAHTDLTPWTGAELMFPSTFQDQLASPGDLRLYPFSGSAGTDVLIGLSASGDIDARLFVYSGATLDWIARNDDGPSAPDPLIDAPLTASGPMMLVVENIIPTAATLTYSISASQP